VLVVEHSADFPRDPGVQRQRDVADGPYGDVADLEIRMNESGVGGGEDQLV
jgi:hypothetical protein